MRDIDSSAINGDARDALLGGNAERLSVQRLD
jgi:hypothetical protein